jgi:hypothetical protein
MRSGGGSSSGIGLMENGDHMQNTFSALAFDAIENLCAAPVRSHVLFLVTKYKVSF